MDGATIGDDAKLLFRHIEHAGRSAIDDGSGYVVVE